MLDILDRLQAENGLVRLVLSNGMIAYGKPDCIVYDEYGDGDEVYKMIRFEPLNETQAVHLRLHDIAEYTRCNG